MSEVQQERKDIVKVQQLSEAISERYLAYAMSTIVSRSLPDVRDGLKPVHRRILYGMRQLKLDPKSGYKKCARVVGDVMGKYHPHGDASIYDAMVRLAQSFSVRYPLVMGQGNFGNIDGDSAAAMRYTEAKLSDAALAIMEGLDEDSVDFMDTYSGEEKEPAVMPAIFPNLLLNGANGIAVGMATNIPPHNVLEVCDAIVALIKKPDMTVAELVEYVKAPDFPTGGIINQDKQTTIEVYETGRGTFKVRAKWEREDLSYGNYQIVISEIPYQVVKSKLIERIADLMEQGKLPTIGDIRDESTEDIRIVIEPKSRTIDPKIIMAQLFSLTELESKFALNMNVLDKNCVPRVMSLKEVLTAYIDHQVEVLTRRTDFRLKNIAHRLEILEGYLTAYLNLDRVIHIIREYDDAKEKLMEEFKLTELQADSILNMKLRSLRKLEEMEIRGEADSLRKEQSELQLLNSDTGNKLKKITEQVKNMRAVFAKDKKLSARLTQIDEVVENIVVPVDAFIPKEPITIILSAKGWIKSVKNHVDLNSDFSFKDGDSLDMAIHAYTNDKVLFAMSNGQFFTLDANKIPSGRGYGDPVRLMIDLPIDAELVRMFVAPLETEILVATKNGYGFKTKISDCIAQTKTGRQVVNVSDDDKLVKIHSIVKEDDSVAVVGDNRKLLVFDLAELPSFSRGKGVILQKYKEPKTYLADIKTFVKADGLRWQNGARNFKVDDVSMWGGKRASVGHMPPDGFPKSNRFSKE
ncbi:MAG: DNA topoisomerase IV subunit A [Alphaproteobacteria bacterium]|nr:DNA topoisomerase IV subunit A [Alphaproteobacteria bacterium]